MQKWIEILKYICLYALYLRNIYACAFQNLRAIPAKCLSIEYKKLFANHLSDKDFIYKLYKDLTQPSSKKKSRQ